MLLKKIVKKMIYRERSNSNTYIKYLKKKGVKIGDKCRIFNPINTIIDLQNPYLISMGDNVRITNGVIILTHDYSWSVLSNIYDEILGRNRTS